jgi:uncharacterized membrane protein SirB2
MNPLEFYPQFKQAHVGLVVASVSLFALRGVAVLAGQRWPLVRPLRVGSVIVDTLLLIAGAALWWMLSLHPVREAWLGTKLLLLPLYVVLGALALRRARTARGRAAAYVAALACVAVMAAAALAHDPLGAWQLLASAWPGG